MRRSSVGMGDCVHASNDWNASITCLTQSFITWHRLAREGVVRVDTLKTLREALGSESLQSFPIKFTLLHRGSLCPDSELLGKGQYATVYGRGGRAYKIAKFRRQRSWHDISLLRCNLKELFFLHAMNHANIARPTQSQIVMEHGRITRIIHEFPKASRSVLDAVEEGSLSLTRMAAIIGQVAAALDYMHSRDIVHGDVTPGNILLNVDGSAVLTDFSLTTFLDKGPEIAFGTLFWRAPEGMLDGKSDVWGLGVVLMDMLFSCVFARDVLRLKEDRDIERVWQSTNLKHILWDKLASQPSFQGIQCIDLVTKMLAIDPVSRCTAADVLRHPFIRKEHWVNSSFLAQSRGFEEEIILLYKAVVSVLQTLGVSYSDTCVFEACDNLWCFLWRNTWDENDDFESMIYHVITLLDYKIFETLLKTERTFQK